MKKYSLALFFALFSFQSFASSESIATAINSMSIKQIEKVLAKQNYSLKSIVDNEAGEGFANKCGCSVFTVTFQKAVENEDGFGFQKTLKEYSLEINHLFKSEEISELK